MNTRRVIYLLMFIMCLAVASAAEAFLCDRCGHDIKGEYMVFPDGRRYCKECMQGKKCIQCGQPSTKTLKGDPVCDACFKSPRLCHNCGKLVGMRYFTFNGGKDLFCKDCIDNKPRCFYCASPTSQRSEYGVHLPLCKDCSDDLIRTQKEYDKLLRECVTIIERDTGLKLDKVPPIEITEDIHAQGQVMSGKEMGLMRQRGDERTIIIQKGMPRSMACLTLAHEWGHVWFSYHGDKNRESMAEEGFCQWVAGKVLKDKGYKDKLSNLQQRHDMYGNGYRMMAQLEKDLGVVGVINYMQGRSK